MDGSKIAGMQANSISTRRGCVCGYPRIAAVSSSEPIKHNQIKLQEIGQSEIDEYLSQVIKI